MFVSRNICFLAFLYFLQGWPYGFQAQFLPVYFRSNGMSLASIGIFKILLFPWMCKALWAPLVDTVGTKQGWLLWSMLGLATACLAGTFTCPSSLWQMGLLILVFNLLTSTQDIAVDGTAIQILSSSELAGGNIAQVVGYKVGAVVGGGLMTWLSGYVAWTTLFGGLFFLYLFAIFAIRSFFFTHLFSAVPQTNNSIPSGNDKVLEQLKININTNYTPKDDSCSEESVDSVDEDNSYHSMGERSAVLNHSVSSWIQGMAFQLLHTEGTRWIIMFVLCYKLGEQGAFNLVPLFLVDQGVPTSDVGFWLGMVGQGFSIAGSLCGGASPGLFSLPPKQLLHWVFLLRAVCLAIQWTLVLSWQHLYATFGYFALCATVVLMSSMHLLSGMITTLTFTLMMHCSQRAPASVQATHYTTLATFEVMGKLCFAIVVGWLADCLGYSATFLIFTFLAVLVIPLLEFAPSVVWITEGNK